LNSAQLQGADLIKAHLQGAELNYANLLGADLREAQLQGADLSFANLKVADLRRAELQGAKLEGAELQGAHLALADIWLVAFPPELAGQSPAPLGVADLKMSPLSPEAKEQLKQDLNSSITDSTVLSIVMARLDEILRNEPPNWEDANSWADYARNAKEPSAEELGRFHGGLACDDAEGTIASTLARRATKLESEQFRKAYAKSLASALLDESCKGGKALNAATRAVLKTLASTPE
jgi:hypothetical protein